MPGSPSFSCFSPAPIPYWWRWASHAWSCTKVPLELHEGEEFKVDRLLRHRHSCTGTYEYLVHWKGYDPSFDLWLPEPELSSTPDLLAAYKAAHGL